VNVRDAERAEEWSIPRTGRWRCRDISSDDAVAHRREYPERYSRIDILSTNAAVALPTRFSEDLCRGMRQNPGSESHGPITVTQAVLPP